MGTEEIERAEIYLGTWLAVLPCQYFIKQQQIDPTDKSVPPRCYFIALFLPCLGC